ncbi:MAG: hypothetical protein AB7L66_16295 [Gemmatimonadales bacterium]
MTDDFRPRRLAAFFRIYGWLSLGLFSVLTIAFIVRPASWEAGGRWHWLVWGPMHDPVPPMLLAVYVVWSWYLLRAAQDVGAHRLFLEFTAWANLAHGVIMIPHALAAPEYSVKFLTDIPFVFLPAIAWIAWRPSPRSTGSGDNNHTGGR